jgi:hypothetical protein
LIATGSPTSSASGAATSSAATSLTRQALCEDTAERNYEQACAEQREKALHVHLPKIPKEIVAKRVIYITQVIAGFNASFAFAKQKSASFMPPDSRRHGACPLV